MIHWTIGGRSRTFAGVPQGATITWVYGRWVVGHCEVCGRLLYEESKYDMDEEGIMCHSSGQRCRSAAKDNQ